MEYDGPGRSDPLSSQRGAVWSGDPPLEIYPYPQTHIPSPSTYQPTKPPLNPDLTVVLVQIT